MNFQRGYLASGSSIEAQRTSRRHQRRSAQAARRCWAGVRGSAGLEMVLISFMALVFLVAPLMCFLFEAYAYGLCSLKWSAAVENGLDQLVWQLDAHALSEADGYMRQSAVEAALRPYLEEAAQLESGERWTLAACRFEEGVPPTLTLELQVSYAPKTFVGAAVARAGVLRFEIRRVREFPIDR